MTNCAAKAQELKATVHGGHKAVGQRDSKRTCQVGRFSDRELIDAVLRQSDIKRRVRGNCQRQDCGVGIERKVFGRHAKRHASEQAVGAQGHGVAAVTVCYGERFHVGQGDVHPVDGHSAGCGQEGIVPACAFKGH